MKKIFLLAIIIMVSVQLMAQQSATMITKLTNGAVVRTDVNEVEKITGFNFFASLPKKVETKVEAMTYSQWKNIIK